MSDENRLEDALNVFDLAMAHVSSSGDILWATPIFKQIWADLNASEHNAILSKDPAATVQTASGEYSVKKRHQGDFTALYLQSQLGAQESVARYLSDREALLLTSRSLSIGEMASTMAHELNQPLGSISNLLQVLKLRLSKIDGASDDLTNVIDKALTQVGYSTGIITRMREYVEDRKPRREPTQLTQLLSDAADLLDWELARYAIKLDIDVPSDMPPVMIDRVMLQQVVTNLARNGIEAMRSKPRGERKLSLCAEYDGNEVDLIIADTGHGMSAEQAAKLFTPFFSTKSGGMGIGLNICRSIVELHGGSLWHERGQGGGMAFHVTLPFITNVAAP